MKTITKYLRPNVGTLILIGLLFLAQSVGALPGVGQAGPSAPSAVSQTVISYQGTLTDKNGNPLNQTVTMEFALYDAATGGNLLWGPETQTVAVSEGLFHVLLGSVEAISPAALTGDLYLDIKVNGETLSPRELLASVLYSARAGHLVTNNTPDVKADAGGIEINDEHGHTLRIDGNELDSTGDFHLQREHHKNVIVYGDIDLENNTIFLKNSTNSTYGIGFDTEGGSEMTIFSDNIISFTESDADVVRMVIVANSGRVGIGTENPRHGQVQIDTAAVPLAFRETDQSGGGSLWRLVLDSKQLRFDASQDGSDFDPYKSPLTMYANGSLGCNGLIEANLQTPEEHAAGGNDRFEKGDLLCWADERLEKCATVGDPLVQAVADAEGRPIVIGAELVKVLGPVKKGDYLIASDVPGYAVVAPLPTFGTVIAQALEDFDGERGIIKAMIRKM